MKTEKDQVREDLVNLFDERTKRLLRLIELHAPAPIICAEVQMIWDAAFALYPEGMQRKFGESVGGMCSEKLGVCRYCRVRQFQPKLGMCQACWDEAKEMGDEIG